MLRNILLVVLSDGEPRHGYAILKACRRRTGFDVSPGTIYRELQRLRKLGQIEPTGDVYEADPRRVAYRITARGRDSARAWLARKPRPPRRPIADDIDYRLAVFDAMEPERALAFLAELHAQLRLTSELLVQDHRLAASDGDEGLAGFLRERQARHVEADVAFVEALRKRLAQETDRPPAEPRVST